jgi:hypothetical protein
MDFSDEDLERRAEADRRVVDPPIEVQRRHGRQEARSIGGCGTRGNGSDVFAVQTVSSGGSKLLIFVPRTACDNEASQFSFSPVTARSLP